METALVKWLLGTTLGKTVLVGAILGILGAIGYMAFRAYISKVEEVSRLETQMKEKTEEHNRTVKQHTDYVANVQKAIADDAREKDELRADMHVLMEKNHELSRILAEHNLAHLAAVKPNLVERRINNATERVFRELEEATSSAGVLATSTDTGR